MVVFAFPQPSYALRAVNISESAPGVEALERSLQSPANANDSGFEASQVSEPGLETLDPGETIQLLAVVPMAIAVRPLARRLAIREAFKQQVVPGISGAFESIFRASFWGELSGNNFFDWVGDPAYEAALNAVMHGNRGVMRLYRTSTGDLLVEVFNDGPGLSKHPNAILRSSYSTHQAESRGVQSPSGHGFALMQQVPERLTIQDGRDGRSFIVSGRPGSLLERRTLRPGFFVPPFMESGEAVPHTSGVRVVMRFSLETLGARMETGDAWQVPFEATDWSAEWSEYIAAAPSQVLQPSGPSVPLEFLTNRNGTGVFDPVVATAIQADTPAGHLNPRHAKASFVSTVVGLEEGGFSTQRMFYVDNYDTLAVEIDQQYNEPESVWSRAQYVQARNKVFIMKEGEIAGLLVIAVETNRIHVLKFAVHSAFRNQGIEQHVLGLLEQNARENQRANISFEVSDQNVALLSLLGAHGYEPVNHDGSSNIVPMVRRVDVEGYDVQIPAPPVRGSIEWKDAITRMTPEHFGNVLAIDAEAYPEKPLRTADRLQAHVEEQLPDNAVITRIPKVVEYEGQAIAFMTYINYREGYEIARLAVHPDYQRDGVASALIDDLIARVQDSDRKTYIAIELPADEWTSPAMLFLREKGFVAEGYSEGDLTVRLVFRDSLVPEESAGVSDAETMSDFERRLETTLEQGIQPVVGPGFYTLEWSQMAAVMAIEDDSDRPWLGRDFGVLGEPDVQGYVFNDDTRLQAYFLRRFVSHDIAGDYLRILKYGQAATFDLTSMTPEATRNWQSILTERWQRSIVIAVSVDDLNAQRFFTQMGFDFLYESVDPENAEERVYFMEYRPQVQIKASTSVSVDDLIEVEEAVTDEPMSATEFDAVLSQKGTSLLVAKIGRQVVGFAIYEKRGGFMKASRVVEHPGFANRDIATGLLDNLMATFHADPESQSLGVEMPAKGWSTSLKSYFDTKGFVAVVDEFDGPDQMVYSKSRDRDFGLSDEYLAAQEAEIREAVDRGIRPVFKNGVVYMVLKDMPAVMALNEASGKPWSLRQFALAKVNNLYQFVVNHGGRTQAFHVSRYVEDAVWGDYVRVEKFGVNADFDASAAAPEIMRSWSTHRGITPVGLRARRFAIPEEDLAAQKFFRQMGFVALYPIEDPENAGRQLYLMEYRPETRGAAPVSSVGGSTSRATASLPALSPYEQIAPSAATSTSPDLLGVSGAHFAAAASRRSVRRQIGSTALAANAGLEEIADVEAIEQVDVDRFVLPDSGVLVAPDDWQTVPARLADLVGVNNDRVFVNTTSIGVDTTVYVQQVNGESVIDAGLLAQLRNTPGVQVHTFDASVMPEQTEGQAVYLMDVQHGRESEFVSTAGAVVINFRGADVLPTSVGALGALIQIASQYGGLLQVNGVYASDLQNSVIALDLSA